MDSNLTVYSGKKYSDENQFPVIGRKFTLSLPFTVIALIFMVSCSMQGKNSPDNGGNPEKLQIWLTTGDGAIRFIRQPDGLSGEITDTLPGIIIDTTLKYQEIDGFGFTLTGGSAMLLAAMDGPHRSALLKELFSTEGIGVSYLRISIGASDLDEKVFSYSDLPEGESDPLMERFSLDPDRKYLIPVLKEILQIFPELKIMGSPWSPPVWMKTNGKSVGGSLKPEYYDAYARYFVRYIQGMAEEGIPIDAITVQNEPLHPGNNPSLLMPAKEQTAFIRDHLGPAFVREGINTKIVIYDHNADRIDYPLEVLSDEKARQFIDGTAFHLYGGSISALSRVHEEYPDKHLYFTEQWIGAPSDFGGDFRWHMREVIIGSMRNSCRVALEWNLAADPEQKPHTEGGCTRCLGAVTLDGNQVRRNTAWYIIAHAAKFVRPGSVRTGSSEIRGLPNVAFLTPEGRVVLIVLNDRSEKMEFSIKIHERVFNTALEGGSAATYVW